MRNAETLTPLEITAKARTRQRLGLGFGPRFFLLLGIGLVWLGGAFYDARFYYALAAWDALVLLAWAVDLASLPSPQQLSVTRLWSRPAALSVPSGVELVVENSSRAMLYVQLVDNVPFELRSEAPAFDLKCPAQQETTITYEIRPAQRGDRELGAAFLRYQGPLRIAERWAIADLEQKICVYPNLDEAREHSMYLVRSRQIEMERRHTRMRGAGREFESLREYRPGDEFRDICWTAAARRGKLVTRLFQLERSQTIWLVMDAGRLMRARIGGLSKLDLAVNAALSLAQVAMGTGDRVGLLAYGRHLQARMLPHRGSGHLRQLIQQLAQVHSEGGEGDHLQALSALLSIQKRRSLVIWLTDFPETAMTPEVIEAATQAAARHLVLFLVIGHPELAELAFGAPTTIGRMYRATAAQETYHRRDLLLRKLRQRGALALEVTSSTASAALVNSYLEIKQRNSL